MDPKEVQLRDELRSIDSQLEDQTIYSDSSYPRLAKRRSQLAEIIELYNERHRLTKAIAEAEVLKASPEKDIQTMAIEEVNDLIPKLANIEDKILEATIAKDPNAVRDVIIEIRAAAGGDESSLFAADLFRMYSRWAETHGFKIELINESPNEVGSIALF